MDEDKSQLQDKLTRETNEEKELSKDELTQNGNSELEEAHKELKEQKEKYLLLLAEIENARKRMQKEKHETTRFAVENVIREFLTPLDHFESAMSFAHQTSKETQAWAKGFEMILTQFKDILINHQVIPFTSEGKEFDPHLHEVIEMEETENHRAGVVIQEFLRGYKCGDRVLRPARVKVSKQISNKKEEEKLKEEHQEKEHKEEGEN